MRFLCFAFSPQASARPPREVSLLALFWLGRAAVHQLFRAVYARLLLRVVNKISFMNGRFR